MTTVNSANSATSAAVESATTKMALNTQDFLEIMITELTNQDPFEPMKNQDLLNQMSTIQQLQSNQEMNASFKDMIGRLDGFLDQQKLSDATGLIGQMVSGSTESGLPTYGKVVSVTMDGSDIYLELDNGWLVPVENMNSLGGTSGQDLVGQQVLGATPTGDYIVGTVESVELSGDGTTLVLDSGESISLTTAMPLNGENAAGLIGMFVAGESESGEISGIVNAVSFAADSAKLILQGGAELPLSGLTRVINTNS
ncbi:MAG: hypothetical protein JW936_05270 [Sedimentisphaerales bacterium]|nr:hypothetical protein [Sedimentisphaerales bacterium]